jgi:hypothetical protein
MERLPTECIQQILNNCSYNELVALSRINIRIRKLANENIINRFGYLTKFPVLLVILTAFFENKIQFCISGGFVAYIAGCTTHYSDVDIFVNCRISQVLAKRKNKLPYAKYFAIDYYNSKYIKKKMIICRHIVTTNRCMYDFISTKSATVKSNSEYSDYVTSTFDLPVSCISMVYDGHSMKLFEILVLESLKSPNHE